MKKAMTTLDEFRRALAMLEKQWKLAEYVECTTRGAVDDETLTCARLQVSEPEPVRARGRGERVKVDVSTLWNHPPFGTEAAPLAALGRQIAEWPGVESVGPATVDTQLRAIWGFAVTLRLSQ